MPVSNGSPPRLPQRPVLRREGQQDRDWIGASSTDEARHVTFAVDEEAGQARSRQNGRGSGDSSSRDCDQRAAGGGGAAAAAITGATIPSSRSANASPGNDDGNSNSGGGGGGGRRITNAAATAPVSGATPNSNALGRGVALPAVAAAQAALSVSPVNRPGARQREVDLSTRRRRVDDAGGGGGRENSGTGCRRAAGGSARGAAGRQRGPPLGVRENNAAVSGAGPLWREDFPARGGGGGGGGEGPRGTTGGGGRGRAEPGGNIGTGRRQGSQQQRTVDDASAGRRRRGPVDEPGGDPTTAGVDGSRRWPSASTNLDSFRGGGRGGKGANTTRTTSQSEEEGNDVDSGGGGGSGSSSCGGGQRGQIARRGAREPSPSAGEDVSPGCARGGKRAKRTVEGRDDGDRGGGTDDGQGLFEGSGDEGCTYFEYEDPAAGSAQDDGRHEDNGPRGAPQKELLRVRGLCRMQGSVLALVEWSIVDVDGAASTELSFVLSSTLKAEWPRQYIDYLEAKMVFEEEKNDGA